MNPYDPPKSKENKSAKRSAWKAFAVVSCGLFLGWAIVTVAIKTVVPVLVPNVNVYNVE